MKKKGEVNGIGILLGIFVAVIAAIVIFQSVATSVGSARTTTTYANQTVTVPLKGEYTDISGVQEILGTYTIWNRTTAVIATDNITLVERVGTDGMKTVSIYNNDGRWNSSSVNVSATFGNDGYIEDSSAWAVTSLIVIFAALAIAVFTLIPILKNNGIIDM